MGKPEYKKFIDANEAGAMILDFISSEEFKKMLDNCAIQSNEFRQGAMFGAVAAFSYVNANATQYIAHAKENENEADE